MSRARARARARPRVRAHTRARTRAEKEIEDSKLFIEDSKCEMEYSGLNLHLTLRLRPEYSISH